MSSVVPLMQELLRPGETIVLAGRRGHGKTATAISIAQHALEGDYRIGDVEVITNVVFGRVPEDGGMPVEDYPPGVHHEDTMAGTLRRAGGILREHGSGGCTILWILDEAQNYMMADQNATRENMALVKYLGNARKFDICNIFLTPTINNLAPRVRCFPTGETKSGYCSAQMFKDRGRARELLGSRIEPRSITFVRTDAEQPFQPVYVEPAPWIRSIYGDAEPGCWGYDTKSMATFDIGENSHGVPFSLEGFLKATSKGLSHEIPDRIDAYFSEWEAQEPDEGGGRSGDRKREKAEKAERRCRWIHEKRCAGMTFEDIAAMDPERKMPDTIRKEYTIWRKRGGGAEAEE